MVRLEKKDTIFLIIVFIVVLADQITKFIFRNSEIAIRLIGNLLLLTPSKNYGAGFSLLQGKASLLIWFAIFVVGVIVYYYYNIPNKLRIYVALLLGGTIGNLIDRVTFGYVTDFIDINIWNGYVWGIYFKIWPAFNIADIAIFTGVIALIVYYWKKDNVDRKLRVKRK